ncbi:hypothetical protein TanjilG_19511 [Lupinus angustifolius]|uniref:DM2 domain-containing protein n=1 Tax=Lupinus angustifolius TaxID=3871 RepID=A0A1J7HNU5_LUPAN|nr:PREDICTED: SWI/SNF complex component SNF12 homolog [Lupinus angustifolius]OIW14463.1 hypothetical protein TanjilG_19511 [Lupinus angustifolius]
MSENNGMPSKGPGGSMSPFGNAGIGFHSTSGNPGFSYSQPQIPAGFQGQYMLSQAQAHAIAQANAQAQFQAQLQAHGLNLNQNFGVPRSSFSALAGNAIAKRLPMKAPTLPVGFSPLKPVELMPGARRKKQKLDEKHLQDRVATVLPESAIYTQLLEFEARVDALYARKKIDIQEALKNPPCIQKTLRIYVFNTFANQTHTFPTRSNAEPPTWTLKIVGRILEDNEEPDQPGGVQKSTESYPKFSSFFKRVTISLDQRLYPDNHIIKWENARSAAPHEGFEVKRKGDKEFSAHIRLEMNHIPEKFKLSPALKEVLGIEVDTRPRIIAAIWHYVKARKLQNPNDPSFFHCDPHLQKVFGEEKMKFTDVAQRLSHHLLPPQPILLEHKIKLSGNSPVGSVCYDLMVDIPFPIQMELSSLLANAEKNKEIDACDEAICGIIKKIHEHRRRRAFFLGFSQSPVELINALIESQSRDLKLAAGESSRNAEKERRSDFFNQPWVEDAVVRYLNRKPAARSNAPGTT